LIIIDGKITEFVLRFRSNKPNSDFALNGKTIKKASALVGVFEVPWAS
jgi:hypothetical protein